MTRVAVLFAIVSVCAFVALFYLARTKRTVHAQSASAFVPDRNNSIRLSVLGWSLAELGGILADFSKQYDLPREAMVVEIMPANVLTVTFPNDIDPKLLFFLVNYIQYPNDFDLARRTIGAVAHVILTPAFGVPDPGLIGKRATIYVPADDTEYDLVYARTEAGTTYQISFTDLIWDNVTDARVPSVSRGL